MSAWTAATLADRRRDLAEQDLRAGDPLRRARAYTLAQQQTPALVRWWSWVRSVLLDGVTPGQVRAALADALGLAELDAADRHDVEKLWDEDTGGVVERRCSCGERWWHDTDHCPDDPNPES